MRKNNKNIASGFSFEGPNSGKVYNRPYGSVYTIYLSGSIGPSEDYIDELDTIRSANNNDIIQFIINSEGGDLMTGLQLRRVMLETEAHIQTIVEGQCASAATMIFLAGDELLTDPHSIFMFHNYSGGTVGKGGEMHEQISFERRWSIELMHDIYQNFLTKQEINAMLDGKDYWFTGQQVIDRLQMINEREAQKQKKKNRKAKPAVETEIVIVQ